MSHLVVLDFEWTADNRKRMLPVSEITQFPSVLVRLDGQRSSIIDQFDTFVRPTLNPTLTPFSIQLTAISQSDVDAAPTLVAVVSNAANAQHTCLRFGNLYTMMSCQPP